MTTKLLKTVQERTRKVRETIAAETFAWPTVLDQIERAANQGEEEAAILPPRPLNLRATPAAGELVTKLESLGFRTAWEPRRDRPDRPEFFALVIRWGGGGVL